MTQTERSETIYGTNIAKPSVARTENKKPMVTKSPKRRMSLSCCVCMNLPLDLPQSGIRVTRHLREGVGWTRGCFEGFREGPPMVVP